MAAFSGENVTSRALEAEVPTGGGRETHETVAYMLAWEPRDQIPVLSLSPPSHAA